MLHTRFQSLLLFFFVHLQCVIAYWIGKIQFTTPRKRLLALLKDLTQGCYVAGYHSLSSIILQIKGSRKKRKIFRLGRASADLYVLNIDGLIVFQTIQIISLRYSFVELVKQGKISRKMSPISPEFINNTRGFTQIFLKKKNVFAFFRSCFPHAL